MTAYQRPRPGDPAVIELAPATGRLLREQFLGLAPHLDPAPFRVDRPAVIAA
ncbi:hypothetical protein [Kribbella sp. NPDC004536]|uniref:hypothetical protein n=1 Tax=Kribbella sp. NPDC004536 TaxID=3364106 RepID=UPI0036C69A4F